MYKCTYITYVQIFYLLSLFMVNINIKTAYFNKY